jgi:hypothetical protein
MGGQLQLHSLVRVYVVQQIIMFLLLGGSDATS